MISSRFSKTGTIAFLLMIALALFPAASAESVDKAGYSPWSTFFSISFRGYDNKAVFTEISIADIAIGFEPFKWRTFIPSLSMHCYLPTFIAKISAASVGASLDLTYIQRGDRAITCILGRDSVWAPRLRLAFGFQLCDPANTFFMLTASPLGIFDGSGYYSIGAVDFAYKDGMEPAGWGIGLCEFTYYIH